MGWKCYTGATVAPGVPDDELAALDYRIEWALNSPAVAVVILNDDSGAKSQAYTTGYLGTSYLALEQPAATQIFRGRITAIEPNPREGTLTLTAEDWLSQLADRAVIYDTRANLGNGYREYPAIPYAKTTGHSAYVCGWEHNGAAHVLELPSHGELGGWANDQWNGAAGAHALVLPTKHFGQQTDTLLAYDETATVNSGAFDTDAPADGETYTFLKDTNVHQLINTDAADSGFHVDYKLRSLAVNSGCVASLDALRVYATAKFYGVAAASSNMGLYHTGYGAYVDNHFPTGLPDAYAKTFNVTASFAPTNYFDANGDLTVRFNIAGGAGTADLDVDQLYAELDYTVDTANTTTYPITDTEHEPGGPGTQDRITLNGDPITDGCVRGWPWSITRVVTIYVADLVTTYDELVVLDAATDVVASTNYVARHFHRLTPLTILRDLARADGTDFWLDSDLDLHWNDAYSVVGAPTWSDPGLGGTYEFLSLEPSGYRLKDIINEAFVEGATEGTYKIAGTYSDAGSIADYGQRSVYVQNSDIYRSDEALADATTRVLRQHDPSFQLTAVLNGYNTRALGETVVVHSDKLNIQSVNYVISRKTYDSSSALSTFDLTPKLAINALTVRPPVSQLLGRLDERIHTLEANVERASRYTEVWT